MRIVVKNEVMIATYSPSGYRDLEELEAELPLAFVRANLCNLSPRRAEVLVRWLGLHGDPKETMPEIAASRNVSRGRISQIRDRAVRDLITLQKQLNT